MVSHLKKTLLISFGLFLVYMIFILLGTGFYLKKDLYPFYSYKSGKREIYFSSQKPKYWVSVKGLNPKVKWPIILSEDWAFYEHSGVDWNQISKVLKESIIKQELTRGASTISQQLVKNLYLSQSRSLFRKINEFFLTKLLETFSTKDWILERYMNIVELGERVDGVGRASWYYFKKPQHQLTYREGAFLAMLLPSPKKYSQSFRQKLLSPYANKQILKILQKLVVAKIISKDEFDRIASHSFIWE